MHLYREKASFATSAPTGSHRSPPPPFRRGRRIEHYPHKGTETHSPSLPRASRGRGTAKRWKGRYERPTHLYREKASFAASAPTGSHRSPPPPFRRGRRIEHYPRKGTETHSSSLPRASRGRETAKRWKGRYERSMHLYREKASFATSAPTGSHRSPPPPFRRER